MTLDEAQRVGKILEHADRGCPVCISDLVRRMQKEFPEFAWESGKYGDKVCVSEGPEQDA